VHVFEFVQLWRSFERPARLLRLGVGLVNVLFVDDSHPVEVVVR